MSLNVGDGVISIGANLDPLKKAVAAAQQMVKQIPNINLGAGGNQAATQKAVSGNQALAAAKLRAALAAADLAGKVQLLDAALGKLTPDTAKYYNMLARLILAQNAQTKAQEAAAVAAQKLADRQARAAQVVANAQARAANQLQAAQQRAALSSADHAGKLNILQAALDKTTVGTTAYYNALTKLNREKAKSITVTNGWKDSLISVNGILGKFGVALGVKQLFDWGIAMGRAGNSLERTQATTEKLAGSTEAYKNVVKLAREQQDIFGGSLERNINAMRGLVPLSRSVDVELKKLTRTSQLLSVLDPTQDTTGAVIALREFLTASQGDAEGARSLAERYELNREALKNIIRSTGDAEVRIQSLNRLLAQQGITFEAITAQVNTTAQAYTNLGTAWSNFTTNVGSGLSDAFVPYAQFLTGLLTTQEDFAKGTEMMWKALTQIYGIGNRVSTSTRSMGDSFNDVNIAVGANTAGLSQYTGALKGAEIGLETVNQRLQENALAIAQAEIALWPYEDAVKESTKQLEAQKNAVDAAEQALQPYRDEVEKAQEAVDAQQRAIKEAEKGLKPYKEAVDAAKDALKEQQDALEDAERGLESYRDAVDDAQHALDEAQRAVDVAERGLREYQDAVDDAERAVDDQKRALEDAERGLQGYRDAVTEASRAVDQQQRALDAAEKALQPYKDAVEAAQQAVEDQQRKIEMAERALKPYEDALRASQDALDAQTEKTDQYKKALDEQNAALDDAKKRMADWLNVPLAGSRAFSDRLFDLDQQTAALQLKLLNLRIGKEDHKKSPLEEQLEQVNNQVQETSLRLATLRTSGGDKKSIDEAEALYRQLRDKQDALSTRVALEEPSDDPAVKQIEKQIQDLADETQRTKLEEQVTLDPARRRIQQMGDTTQEMSPEEIIAGYQRSREEVDQLTTAVDKAQTAYDAEAARLDEATAAHKRNQEALEAQQRAIEPLREALVGLQDNVYNAQKAFDAADAALDPMRQHLDELKGTLDNAKVALDDAEYALQPVRDRLAELEGVARLANDELERQEQLIQPLKDALVPLKDALADANWQLAEQDRLLNPLRDTIKELEGNLSDANDEYDRANKLIDPLRTQLGLLEEAQDGAARALRDHDKLIDPMREKERLLEEQNKKNTDALNAQRDAIDPLRRKQTLLGLSHDALTIQIDAAKTALDNFVIGMGAASRETPKFNASMVADFTKAWDEGHTGSISDITKKANQSIWQNFLDVWGRDDDSGIRGDMTKTNSAMRSTWLGFWGVDEGTGIRGFFNETNKAMRDTFNNWWGIDDTSGIRGFFNEAWNGLDGKGGIAGTLSGSWSAIQLMYDENKDSMMTSILAPFVGAGAGVGALMLTLANNVIRGFNLVLGGTASFGQGFIDSINKVSDWLIGKKVLDVKLNPIVIPELKGPKKPSGTGSAYAPGLAVGTDNWQGGWARTGEQGREIAILPHGSSTGNVTYLPPGATVLPNQITEDVLRRLPGFAGGLNMPREYKFGNIASQERYQKTTNDNTFFKRENESGIGDAVQRFLDWLKNGSDGLIKRAMSVVGAPEKPSIEGPASAFGDTLGINYLRFGMRKVFTIADEWLHANAPKVIADALSGGLQKGGDFWGFIGGMPREGASPTAPGVEDGTTIGDYPSGIGLDAALNAIIQGGYISGYRFSSGHKGIDIASKISSSIRALIGGRVLRSGYNPDLEGQYIVTEDSVGRGAYYGHMVPGSQLFSAGDIVGAGSMIGTMGSSGAAEGKHIHFELRINGNSINPEDVFAGRYAWPFGPDAGTPSQPSPVTPGGAFWPGTPDNAQQWVRSALSGAGVGTDWLTGMSILGRYESGWYPGAIAFSRDDYNAQRNNHSRGLAQTIPDTFNNNKRGSARRYLPPFGHYPQYGPGGYDLSPDVGDIYDPEENLIASIHYIRGRYGHVNALPGVQSVMGGGGWIGYAHGGMINEPIFGMGASGQKYMFGENGSEIVVPLQNTLAQMDGRLQGMHPRSWQGPAQPVIVEERHVTYDMDIHQQRVDNEVDLQTQIWKIKNMSPNL